MIRLLSRLVILNTTTRPQFNYLDQITIYRNGVQWFVGLITNIRRSGGQQHYIHYEVSGPWWYFENIVYEQFCVQVFSNYSQLTGTIGSLPTNWILPVGAEYDGFSPDPNMGFYNSADPTSQHYYGNYQNYYSNQTLNPDYQYNALLNPVNGNVYLVSHTSHVALNYFHRDNYYNFTLPLTRYLSDAQITDALNWCNLVCEKEFGKNQFTIGNILNGQGVDMPSSETRDQTVAKIIKNQLRLSPDAVTWFDYTTTPPTFNIRRRNQQEDIILSTTTKLTGAGGVLDSVQYSIKDLGSGLTSASAINLVSAEVHPRYELVPPLVTLKYEYNNSIGGQNFISVLFDKYPLFVDSDGKPSTSGTPTLPYAFGAIVSTINMTGFQANGTKANVGCGVIPLAFNTPGYVWDWSGGGSAADPLYLFWRSQSNTLLSDPTTQIDNIAPTLRQYATPNYVTSGALAPWMGVSEVNETLESTIRYHFDNGQIQTQNFTVNVVSTNAKLGTNDYYDSSGDVAAEPMPVGLAKNIYNSLSQLQYDGEVVMEESECSGAVGINNTLNITSQFRPEWATMQAMVVSVSEDIDNGRTVVSFGPTKHLGAGDIVEILRAMRTRIPLRNVNFQNGQPSSSGTTQLADNIPQKDQQYGPQVNPLSVWSGAPQPWISGDPIAYIASVDVYNHQQLNNPPA